MHSPEMLEAPLGSQALVNRHHKCACSWGYLDGDTVADPKACTLSAQDRVVVGFRAMNECDINDYERTQFCTTFKHYP
jgi:hypothetical protein